MFRGAVVLSRGGAEQPGIRSSMAQAFTAAGDGYVLRGGTLELNEACEAIPRQDFVALGTRGVQFYRKGDYPPLRGTYVKFSDSDLLLYTSGYIPFLRTYPGPRVPRPVEVLEHLGDSPWDLVLREIL